MAMPRERSSAYAFAAPPNFSIPDDVQEGQPFEVVAKLRMNGDQLVFQEINGLKLDPTMDESEPQGWEDESGGDAGDNTAETGALEQGDIA